MEIVEESAEYDMKKLIKQRKQLIEDASDFRKYCKKYRENIMAGIPPEKEYIIVMNSIVAKLDRYYKSYCINNDFHLSKEIGGDYISR